MSAARIAKPVMDEPSITLDSNSAARLETVLAQHRAGGGMAVVATHADIALPGAETIDMARHGVPIDVLLGAQREATGESDYGQW